MSVRSPCQNDIAPASGTSTAAITPHTLRPILSGSGMSRMARTTFRRLTRHEEIRMTTNVSTMPMQKARTTFRRLVEKAIRKSSPAMPSPISRTITQPTPTPAMLPMALATSA